ncbi:MAG: c-type cytochrome [Bryobacteraceae bacterium]|jgi:mono/diheme cytochrome c family protein
MILLMGAGARADDPAASIKKVPVHATQSVAGKDLFREYCAVCHGAAGKGDGPAAAALKTAPSDLTRISKNNGGKYPTIKVQHIINGESGPQFAHGSKDMPVWGSIFAHMSANPDLGTVRVYNLVKYIEEIQEK